MKRAVSVERAETAMAASREKTQSGDRHVRTAPAVADDAVDLIGLAVVFWRRRYMVIASVAAVLLAGLAVFYLTPQATSFATSLEVAQTTSGLVESPATILAKLNQSYIPLAVDEYRRETGFDANTINVQLPSGSGIVILENQGGASDRKHYDVLHRKISERLIADHDQLLDSERRRMEVERRRLQSELAELRDEEGFIAASLARVGEKEKLLEKQISEVREMIRAQQQSRGKAVADVSGEAKALTLLLIDNETLQHQERLAHLENTLLIGVKQERDQLEKLRGNNQREQVRVAIALDELQASLGRLKKTQAIALLVEMPEKRKVSAEVVIVVSLFFGLVLGMTLVIVYEFIQSVRVRARTA